MVGFARRDWNDEILREKLKAGIEEYARSKPIDPQILEKVAKQNSLCAVNF